MIIDLVLRTGAVAAVIVATNRLGIWDDSDDSIKLYNESRDRAGPHAQKMVQYLNIRVPDMPPDREKSYLGIYYYNQTVMTIFNFMSICPTYVCMVLEKVPGVVADYGSRARDAYDEYQKQRAIEQEKKARKIMIDDKALVMPLEPGSPDSKRSAQVPERDCVCDDSNEHINEGLMPKNAPKSPYSDSNCVKSPVPGDAKKPLPDTKCKCPKCDHRQAEGWLDNKARCPKRNPCAKTVTEPPRKCDYETRIIYTKGAEN